MPRCVSGIFVNLGIKLIEFVGYNSQVFGISWSFFALRSNGPINDIPKRNGIAVITVEPADKISFVYNCMQTRLRGQYNGK